MMLRSTRAYSMKVYMMINADLTNTLKTLEQKQIELNEPTFLDEIKVIKQQINKILDKQVEIKLKYSKQNYYENGPRAKKKKKIC